MRELAPDAIRVTALPDYQLKVLFSNGEARIFDAAPLLSRKCYAALKNVKLFMQAAIVNGCITWPNDLDIDPDWLYEDSVRIA